MTGRLFPLALASLLTLGFSVTAHAQWKWRDKAGQMHISDLPPPSDVADKDVLQRPESARRTATPAAPASATASAPVATSEKPRVDPELDARLKRTEQDKQQVQKREEERIAGAKAENCSRAKEQLRTLDSGMRIASVNDKGEREIMDDKQRAETAQRARNVIASDCR